MRHLNNQQLIEELKRRFDANFKDLNNQEALISQLVLVNEKLKESEALKSNFLSNIKNEFNNPLASVLGMAKILTTSKIGNPLVLKKVAGHIFKELSNLDFQLRNIFAAAELEAGESIIEISEVDIESLIINSIELCKSKSDEKEISVNFKIKKSDKSSGGKLNLLHFKTDSGKLQMIVVNLLMNAIEFTPEKGKITITLQTQKNAISISFKDSGIGIPKSESAEIFNRFRQLSTGTTREHKGHGLGLAITKSFVELLNGEITVKSDKSGSTFHLVVPEGDIKEAIGTSTNGNETLFRNHEKF
jgi:signal transduction histidine kinase